MDATIVPVPKQRNSREENETVKRGETPAAWEEKPAKNRQKDKDAHWTKKHGKSFFEPVPPEMLDPNQRQSLLYSSDLELGETTKLMLEAIERCRPSRIVVDSLSEIRLLAQGSLRYRHRILALRHYFVGQGATVLLRDDLTSAPMDKTLHSIVHGVVKFEQLAHDYGSERRRLIVLKQRGQAFRGGYHDFIIETGGVSVFPTLVASEHYTSFNRETLGSGIKELDALLGGGLERGSNTLIMGPAGLVT